jgi:hypothetical protein
MRVAVKFCGGCDPAFERGEYFREIKQAVGGRIEWCRPGEGGERAVLLICGCPTACPEEDFAAGAPVLCLTDNRLAPPEAAELLLKEATHGD